MAKSKTVGLMDARAQQIKNLLWKEVASKSTSAAIAFSITSIFIFFYHFELIEMKLPVKVACLCIILANLGRFIISKKIRAASIVSVENLNILRVSIWLNTLAWSVIFSLNAFELNSSGLHFVILITMMTGFLATSVVTLAYDKSIFIPYQLVTLIPLMGVAIYQTVKGLNPIAYLLVINYMVFLLYQLRQYKDYRTQLMQRFNYQLDLEKSFLDLKQGQKTLIEQTSQMIHASKISALGEMAGGLAHEINNSLMIILGSTQQVQRMISKDSALAPDIENKFLTSTASIMKIKSVIEGLKQFSLQMEPQPKEKISLKEIFERTQSYTHEMLKSHNTTFTIDEIPNKFFYCHSFQMTQVLFNLIKNADDALKNSPIENRWVKVHFEMTNNYVLIKVKNSGEAISEENSQKLFQPFFTTKDVGLGTGLSLSISKGVAREHKGDIYFEKNDFTTFVLKMPFV